MAEVTPPRLLSEGDERSHFDCRRDSLDAWFRRYAWHNHMSGISHTVDGLLAATAKTHGMTLVTRNTADLDVSTLNPFELR
jgi:predicted nucleic acid-binding protein